MHRRLALLLCSVAFSALAIAAVPAASAAAGGSPPARPVCAGATKTTTRGAAITTARIESGSGPASAPGGSCWEEVKPYPFGSEGEPIEGPYVGCGGANPQEKQNCSLTVTSMAFRAWNRGLAATSEGRGRTTAYGVWIFNGSSWRPDSTFPGSNRCKGNTIVYAGKLDYWLVGPGEENNWPNLCRFDDSTLAWEPLPIPEATKEHVTERVEVVSGEVVRQLKPGGITSAACFAWDNCWFFGTYGTVVHWNGTELTDASLSPLQGLLQGEYTAAVAREGPAGEPFGVAVGATSEWWASTTLGPLTRQEGTPPAQMYGSSGEAFSPLAFIPFTIPQAGDPYRTDLVAVDFDSAGQGWVAGNPAGLRLTEREGWGPHKNAPEETGIRKLSVPVAQPSPLMPVSSSGAATACEGPPKTRFTYTPRSITTEKEPGAFLWSSIAVIPTLGEALAGGQIRRADPSGRRGQDEEEGEPVIAQAGCNGTTTVTSFSELGGSSAPADSDGGVTAIAATNASNDAWAATSYGWGLDEPPHLYRLTNGQGPNAPEGNDEEQRPLKLTEETPTYVIEPPPPEPQPEPPLAVTQTHKVTLPPAIYDVKAKLHTTKRHGRVYLSLYITFKVRRPVTVGADALRHGHVVSAARPKHFVGQTGLLVLSLNRKHWPTKVSFVS
jgi:hypothetical protein